jgi:hypothetical protein
MGKAGEKQKRTPKIKDAKQSERFKEAALELGANEDSEHSLRVLDKMLGSHRVAEPTGAETTLVDFNSGGVAKLSDGTFWRVALDGGEAARWKGQRVKVIETKMPNPAWRLALVNLETDQRVAVVSTSATY